MKKKIIKLWGVGMIVVLMASLLIVGATPASAGTLAWTASGLPNPPLSNQIAASDVDILEVASNGDMFVVDRQPIAPLPDRVLKSVDGGKSWVAAAPNATIAATNIVALVISPSYEIDNTVFILVNSAGPPVATYTLRSTNGGATFLQYGSAIGAGGTEVGTSLAVEPDYVSGAGQVMVGTANTLAATYGNVYIWSDIAFAWVNQLLAEDITSVAFSTNYGTDRCILAIGTLAGSGTRLHTKIHTSAFDFAPHGAVVIDAAITEMSGVPATDIVSSTIALPGDFNAGFESTKNIFVGYDSGAGLTDGVYRITYSPAPAPYTVVGPVNMGLLAPAFPAINNLAINGNYNAGTLSLYAGLVGSPVVYRTTSGNTPAGPFVWAAPITPATGAGGNGYVALDPGFLTNTTVYNGTATGAANDESAVSVSVDGGAHYYQTGLIDTPVLGAAPALSKITDFLPYSATEWYLVTGNPGGTALDPESLWKTTDGGVTWVRILAVATGTDTAAIRLSQDYATDSVMYLTETGASPGAPLLMRSTDGGATWTLRFYPAALSTVGVGDLLVIDQFVLYVGSFATGFVYTSPNSGSFWNAGPLALATGVNQLAYDAGTGHMLAGSITGTVYRNTGVAWANIGAIIGGTNTFVAFGPNYDGVDDLTLYVGAVGLAGTYRATVGVAIAPQIDAAAPVGICAGIIAAPDGTVYAADATGGGGIMRVLPLAAAEAVAAGDGLLPAGTATLASLAYLPGSNVLYAIENSGTTAAPGADQILTYTDTLTTAVPTVLSPAEGDVLLAATAMVTIEPIAGVPPVPGPAYFVQWNTRPDWLGIGNVIPIPNVINTVNLNDAGGLGVPGNVPIPAGTVIYLRVQNRTPVLGPWSATISVSTQLVPVAPNAPGIIPAAGGSGNTGPGGFNTPLAPTFSWGTVGLATGYEFKLATDAGMTDVIMDLTGPDALGNVSTYALAGLTLEYGTTYYWQVRGVSATSNTAWSPITSFTTMQEPVEPPPPVTVTDVPPPEITVTVDIPPAPPATTITQPPQVVEKISEGYIWAIIIIGAVLVIAVIVLVVRTRRSV